jgi:hypothetical protein
VTYDYRYEKARNDATDREVRRIVMRNVSRSLEMDGIRARIAPTATQHRARVVAELAKRNGEGGKP